MGAVFYREIKAYFSSITAWTVIAAFLVVINFFMMMAMNYYADISATAMQGGTPCNVNVNFVPPMVQSTGLMLLFFLPVLTMFTFSQELRDGTLDLLFTYPISDLDIVMGKFLAGMTVVVGMLALSALPYTFVAWHKCTIELPVLIVGYCALLLLAGSMVAMGMFFSSLTKYPLASVALTYCGALCLWFLAIPDQMAGYVTSVGKLSIMNHLQDMSKGVFNSQDVIYYAALITLFLYLTNLVLESRKWRG
jgi:ABC-2 type transport system permease protein